MKKFTSLLVFFLMFAICFAQTPATKEWNMSAAAFNVLGSLAKDTTLNGLKIYAKTGAEVVIDASSKTLETFSFTHRLKLGGTGGWETNTKPLSRVLEFTVTVNTKITVMGMTSSSTADRILNLAIGNKDSVKVQFPAPQGNALSKWEYNYKGGTNTIYLYSPSSGVNIYYIKAEPASTGLNDIKTGSEYKLFPNPARERVFLNVDHPVEVAIYSATGNLVKAKWIKSSFDPVEIGDLSQGLYIIKSKDNDAFALKLMVL
jgi:hypothetical protein